MGGSDAQHDPGDFADFFTKISFANFHIKTIQGLHVQEFSGPRHRIFVYYLSSTNLFIGLDIFYFCISVLPVSGTPMPQNAARQGQVLPQSRPYSCVFILYIMLLCNMYHSLYGDS